MSCYASWCDHFRFYEGTHQLGIRGRSPLIGCCTSVGILCLSLQPTHLREVHTSWFLLYWGRLTVLTASPQPPHLNIKNAIYLSFHFLFYQSCPSSIAPDIKGISPSSGHFFIWTGQQKGKAPPKSGAFENLRTLSADLQRLSDPSPGRTQLLRESSTVHWQGQVLRAHIDGIFESCCLACPRAPMKYVANAIIRV